METPVHSPDNQSWLLQTLVRAWNNVPPGMESPFTISDQSDGYVISHSGLEGRTLSPDWIAFRGLVRDGYVDKVDSQFVLTDKAMAAGSAMAGSVIGPNLTPRKDVWEAAGKQIGGRKVSVFCAYSHMDASFLGEFKKLMSVLVRSGNIGVWTDKDVLAGREWEDEIDQHLLNDDVIFLLISADFFNSDYCSAKEMTAALERHHAGRAWVIPVIVRDCDWQHSPISSLLALPEDGKPVAGWPDQDEAWADAVRRFRGVLNEITPTLGDSDDSPPGVGLRSGRTGDGNNDSSQNRQESDEPDSEEDEPGILDLEEQAGESSNSIVEQLSLVTDKTMSIQGQIETWLSMLPSDKSNLPLVERKKAAAELATIFEAYSSEVQDSATVIEQQFDLFGESLFGLHRHIDYGNAEQRIQARQFMETARKFSSDLKPFVTQIESARSALKTLPQLTQELRASIKRCNIALSTLANSARKGIDQVERVASAIAERLGSADVGKLTTFV